MIARLVALFLLLFPVQALAQTQLNTGTAPPYTGSTTAITATGYSMTAGQLLLPANSTLQFGTPFSIAYWVKMPLASLTTAPIFFFDTRGGGSFGIFTGLNEAINNTYYYVISAFGTNNSCSDGSMSCFRPKQLANNAWHHVCYTYDGFSAIGYLDGVAPSGAASLFYAPGNTYVPSTSFWSVAPVTSFNGNLRDFRVYSRTLGPSECQQLSYLGQQGVIPTGGSFNTNLVADWRMDACNGSGCIDSSANGNNLIYVTTGPTVTITAPTNGATGLTGNVPVQSTCVDVAGCSSVSYTVDGNVIGSATSAPYTVTWASATYVDGAHTIVATGTNAGGLTSTNTITASSSNGVSAKSFFIAAAGNDSNSCLSSGSPCLTMHGVVTKIATSPLHGGDSILFHAGDTFNISAITASTVLLINGPSSTLGTQNAFSGGTITIGTYGGSGNCHILAAVTTDCVNIIFNTNGSTTTWMAPINVVNVSNVVIQNLSVQGEQTNAQNCPSNNPPNACNIGIRYVPSGRVVVGSASSTTAIQNNEVIGFNEGVYLSGQTDPQLSSFGTMCNPVFQNNYVHGTSLTDVITVGVEVIADCHTGIGPTSVTGSSVISNYFNNIGGTPGGTDGNGVLWANGSTNFIDLYNVSSNYGGNVPGIGPYGNWQFQTTHGLMKGNEAFLSFTVTSHASGDHGCYDFDNGTANITNEYNYCHEVSGPPLNVLTSTAGGIIAGNNTSLYNIYENGQALVNNQNGGLLNAGAAAGFANSFNNTVWNGYNGTIVSGFTQRTSVAAFSASCPAAQSYTANNILVSNSTSGSTSAEFVYFPTGTCSTMGFVSNDYFNSGTNASNLWRGAFPFPSNPSYTTLATWNTALLANDILANPGFAGAGGGGTTCWALGNGIPGQVGLIPCPTAYEITNGALTENTGTDLSQAPYLLYTTTLDYYGNTVPYTGHGGTGTNIGADGAFR